MCFIVIFREFNFLIISCVHATYNLQALEKKRARVGLARAREESRELKGRAREESREMEWHARRANYNQNRFFVCVPQSKFQDNVVHLHEN